MLIQTFVIFVLLAKFHLISSSIDVSFQSKAQTRQSKLQNFEQAMLKVMGLKTRPRPRRQAKVPQYMLDLYNSHSDHPDWSSTRFRFNNNWTSVNTVRALHHKDQIPLKSSSSKTILKFDLSTYPKHEVIHSAELRLYKSKSWTKANETHFRIKLYRLAQPSSQAADVEATLIDSKIVNVSTSGWETFDVRQAVVHWLRNPTNNHGLHVQVESSDGNFVNLTTNEIISDIGDGDEDRYHQERPLLVTYAHDPLNHHHARKKRSSTSRKREQPHHCRRHPLTVQFKDLEWQDWILAPEGYELFFCEGECSFLDMGGSNHAVIQSIIQAAINPEIPNVCCSPTELSALTVLYYKDQDIVIKQFEDMVVSECGCR